MFWKQLAERFADGLERSGRPEEAHSFRSALSHITFHDVDAVQTFTADQLNAVFMWKPGVWLGAEFQRRWQEFANDGDYEIIQGQKALHFL